MNADALIPNAALYPNWPLYAAAHSVVIEGVAADPVIYAERVGALCEILKLGRI